MSSSTVIASIIILLVALTSYAFVSQTMENRRKQRQRLLSGLKQRWKDFKYMATGFPEGFLPKELSLLVHRCLVDVCEQLLQLEPKSSEYSEAITLHTKHAQTLQGKSDQSRRVILDNPQQIKEIRTLLQGLNTFIISQHQRGRITANQFSLFERQIKQLVVQITTDSYILNARQAEGQGKLRLAVHFFLLAKKLLIKEDSGRDFPELMQRIEQSLQRLEQQISEQDPASPNGSKPANPKGKGEPADDEWDEFTSASESSWKKKAIYD